MQLDTATAQKFIKSFNQGQITVPKEIRETLGLGTSFWLKISVQNGKIVAEPLATETNSEEYAQQLLGLSGSWFVPTEWKKLRKAITTRPTL